MAADDDTTSGGEMPLTKKWGFGSSSIPPAALAPIIAFDRSNAGGVVIVGVRIPFWNLVGLLVKLSLAAIPAAIILAIIYALVGGGLISAITAAFYHQQ